jgi:hypothetical protein
MLKIMHLKRALIAALAMGTVALAAADMPSPGKYARSPGKTPPILDAEPTVVVPRQEIVEDRTLEMWSARWWMWLASFAGEKGPAGDRDGGLCGARQEGGTFFLAGTFGSRPVERTCHVPQGKHLFFPLVTYVMMPDSGMGDCAALRRDAAGMVADASLFAELDGKPIEGLQSRSAAPQNCFNLNALSRGEPKVMAASAGYWLMLRPLAKGSHTLHFGGRLPSISQDITYNLQVE